MVSRIMLRDREPFARWLREQLALYRLTQSEFEDQLGFSQGMCSHWVNAKRSPSPRTLQKIAEFFGVNMDFLLTLAGYREATPEIGDELDPRLQVMAKVQRIHWDERSLRYIMSFLDNLIAETREGTLEKMLAPALPRRRAPGRAGLISSPN
jgi:transcriptional regulator with XRE-family HTH domain